MPWDAALLDLMPSTLTVTRLSGVSTDGYGIPTYSTSALSRRCRVTEKQTLVRTIEGTQEIAKTVVWCRSTSTFSPSDKITLPDGTVPPLLAVEEYRDESGSLHHHKLFFG